VGREVKDSRSNCRRKQCNPNGTKRIFTEQLSAWRQREKSQEKRISFWSETTHWKKESLRYRGGGDRLSPERRSMTSLFTRDRKTPQSFRSGRQDIGVEEAELKENTRRINEREVSKRVANEEPRSADTGSEVVARYQRGGNPSRPEKGENHRSKGTRGTLTFKGREWGCSCVLPKRELPVLVEEK